MARVDLLRHLTWVRRNSSRQGHCGNRSDCTTLPCMLHVRRRMSGSCGGGDGTLVALLTRTHSFVLVHKLQAEHILALLARATGGRVLMLAFGTILLAALS